MKTAEVAEELEGAKAAAKILGGEVMEPVIYEIPAGGRSVVFINKKNATPAKYPRQRVKISEKPLK